MKNCIIKKLVTILILVLTLNNYAQVDTSQSALNDYKFTQAIIAKYPYVDFNKDGDISIYEAGNHFGTTMELELDPYQIETLNFTGIKYFTLHTLKIINKNNDAKKIKGYNLNINDIGIVLNASTNIIEKLHFKGIEFQYLDFDVAALDIEKIHLEDCGEDMDISSINKIDFFSPQSSLYIQNTGRFGTLKIDDTDLKTLTLKNVYIENLEVAHKSAGTGYYPSEIERIQLENLSDLKTLKLATYNQLKSLTVSGAIIENLDLTKQTDLEELKINHTKISQIDLSKNTKLTYLDISDNLLTSFNTDANTSLKQFKASSNKIVKNKVEFLKNKLLEEVEFSDNRIDTLNFLENTKLKKLEIWRNGLKKVDLTPLTDLEYFEASENNLKELDFSKNTKLKKVYINQNSLRRIDLSKTQATYIQVRENHLIALNVANGLNNTIDGSNEKHLSANYNTQLRCIIVDPGANTNNYAWEKDATADYALDDELAVANTVLKNKLLQTQLLDADKNGKISTCEAHNFEGTIDISNLNLSENDVTELDRFKNITGLLLNNNNFTTYNFEKHKKLIEIQINDNSFLTIDVSKNTELEYLEVEGNNLSTVDVSKNTKLLGLNCSGNKLSLLSVENNTELLELDARKSNLSKIDISKNTKLDILNVSDNNLTTLDVSKAPKLRHLKCANNAIKFLPLENNNALLSLDCENNQIKWLDLSSNGHLKHLLCSNNPFEGATTVPLQLNLDSNTELLQLNCSNTNLDVLDVSNLKKLYSLTAIQNKFKKINVANTNNQKLVINVSKNPQLKCVQVDATIVNNIPNTWFYDSGVSFNDDDSCIALSTVTNTLDDKVRVYPNPAKEQLFIDVPAPHTIKKVELIDVTGKKVLEVKNTKNITLDRLAKGMFIVKIWIDNAILIHKVVKGE